MDLIKVIPCPNCKREKGFRVEVASSHSHIRVVCPCGQMGKTIYNGKDTIIEWERESSSRQGPPLIPVYYFSKETPLYEILKHFDSYIGEDDEREIILNLGKKNSMAVKLITEDSLLRM